MSKIVGIQKQEGVFEGHPYCNYSFTCLEAYSNNILNAYGNYAKVYKGKVDVLDKWLIENKIDLKSLIGQNVKFLFDDKSKIIQVIVG